MSRTYGYEYRFSVRAHQAQDDATSSPMPGYAGAGGDPETPLLMIRLHLRLATRADGDQMGAAQLLHWNVGLVAFASLPVKKPTRETKREDSAAASWARGEMATATACPTGLGRIGDAHQRAVVVGLPRAFASSSSSSSRAHRLPRAASGGPGRPVAARAAARGDARLSREAQGELKVEQPKRVKRVLKAARPAVSSDGHVDYEQENERELHLVVDILPEALRAMLRDHPEYTQVTPSLPPFPLPRSRSMHLDRHSSYIPSLLQPRHSTTPRNNRAPIRADAPSIHRTHDSSWRSSWTWGGCR